MPVRLKRAYDKPAASDGVRILVDGLWPRGIKKEDLQISAWEKGIAPSPALRKRYGHDPEKWPEFRRRYRRELEESPRKEALCQLRGLAERGNLTLVFGARDAAHSNAAVIAEIIAEALRGGRGRPAKSGRSSKSGQLI